MYYSIHLYKLPNVKDLPTKESVIYNALAAMVTASFLLASSARISGLGFPHETQMARSDTMSSYRVV
jgi:hypothetical protein